MAGLLEQLSEEDREKVQSWTSKVKNPKHEQDIPTELFICSKLGYYYGWQAVETFMRGYIIAHDDNMKPYKAPFTLDDAIALIKGAEKVAYVNMLNNGDIQASANVSSRNSEWAKANIEYTNRLRKEYNG